MSHSSAVPKYLWYELKEDAVDDLRGYKEVMWVPTLVLLETY